SSYVDRSASVNDSELNVKSLIKNLKNVIMKKLFILYMTESSASLFALSVSFSAAFSLSSTPVSVSDSPASAIPVPVTLTSTTSEFVISAFIISSLCFKKMLYRLNKLYLSCLLSNFMIQMKYICVFRNKNADVVLFYTHRFTLISEAILIKDDNAAETILSHSQASLITFSSFSVKKIVYTSDYKHSVSDNSH
ncbi:uncharacterized protein BDCG_16475, partial [Blastomyces dermatitidis ER-3]